MDKLSTSNPKKNSVKSKVFCKTENSRIANRIFERNLHRMLDKELIDPPKRIIDHIVSFSKGT